MPPARPLVVLVGPPGAGKTTVGRMVARRLGVGFTDVDALVVDRAGKSVSDIFLQDGEPAFRELEREVVAQALDAVDGVLALGGGSVLAAGTRERLRGHVVVHLSVGLADGLRRTGLSTARPLLAGVNPRATFKALLDARAPLYREVATVEVDTDRRTAGQVARAVLAAIGHPAGADEPEDDPVQDDAGADGKGGAGPEDVAPAAGAPLPDPTFGPRPAGAQ